MTSEQKFQNFADKLKTFAIASARLEDAWDEIDGKMLFEEYPFKDQLYYTALTNIRNWASKTASDIEKKM